MVAIKLIGLVAGFIGCLLLVIIKIKHDVPEWVYAICGFCIVMLVVFSILNMVISW